MPSRLLLLSCSQRKRAEPDLLPATERYDGPFFRVLRRYQQSCATLASCDKMPPDIYILSAEFGLIPTGQLIPYYERRMTDARAQELRPSVLDGLRDILYANISYQELFLCMGREYRRTLDGWEALLPTELTVRWAEGSMGGNKVDGIEGFCNRATHNLWTLLEETVQIEHHLSQGTYETWYIEHLDNSTYRPLIDYALAQRKQARGG